MHRTEKSWPKLNQMKHLAEYRTWFFTPPPPPQNSQNMLFTVFFCFSNKKIEFLKPNMFLVPVLRTCQKAGTSGNSSRNFENVPPCPYCILKCLSKVLSSKYFCIIASQSEQSYTTAFPNSRHPPPKAMTTFIVLRLLALRRKSFIIYMERLCSVASSYLVPVYQEVAILFSLTLWMETVLTSFCA